MDPDDHTVVDLLEEIRAALDGLGPLLLGRTVDIEMPRLRVLADATVLRRVVAELVGWAVANTEHSNSITVRVARAGKSARIEIVSDGGDGAGDDLADLPSSESTEAALRIMGAEIGTAGPAGAVGYWITVPMAPGASGHADT